MLIVDNITLSSREITPEGYLRGIATITCVGVQQYRGDELAGLMDGLNPNQTYHVFRPPSTVFAKDTINSAKLKPVTDEHPLDEVDAHNYRDLSIGTLGENAQKINDTQLGFPFCITDTNGVKKIEAGTHQLSCGYDGTLRQESGTYKGIAYDLVFDGAMIVNHVALVREGRCGNGARILDKAKNFLNQGGKMFKKNKLNDQIDTDALMEKLVTELAPKMEELIKKPDFIEKLAQNMAANMTSNDYDEEMPPQLPEDEKTEDQSVEPLEDPNVNGDMDEASDVLDEKDMEDEDKDTLDTRDERDTKDEKDARDEKDACDTGTRIGDAVAKRLNVIKIANQISGKDFSGSPKSNKAILVDALSPMLGKHIRTKSADHLMGAAEVLVAKRVNSADYIHSVSASMRDSAHDTNITDDYQFNNSFDMRNFLNKKEDK